MQPNDQFILSLIIGLVGTMIGATPALILLAVNARKLANEGKLTESQTVKIYDELEKDAATRAAERERELIEQIKRYRRMLRELGINPDKVDTGPLDKTKEGTGQT